MKRMICAVVCASLAGLVGCDKGTSVAPATNAAKPEAQRKLTVTNPGDQNVTQDQSDDMTIKIGRTNFDAPVTIELRNLPTGVKVTTKDMTIPAGKDSVVVTVKAEPTAPAMNDHQVTVAAKAPDMAAAVTAFKMDVKAKK